MFEISTAFPHYFPTLIPAASGVCTCYTDLTLNIKYLESRDGNSCVSCQNIPAGDLLNTSGDSTCECKTYAKPDTTSSNGCECQTGYTKAGITWDTDNQVTEHGCILCTAINDGPGQNAADCTSGVSNGCATNALAGEIFDQS